MQVMVSMMKNGLFWENRRKIIEISGLKDNLSEKVTLSFEHPWAYWKTKVTEQSDDEWGDKSACEIISCKQCSGTNLLF